MIQILKASLTFTIYTFTSKYYRHTRIAKKKIILKTQGPVSRRNLISYFSS